MNRYFVKYVLWVMYKQNEFTFDVILLDEKFCHTKSLENVRCQGYKMNWELNSGFRRFCVIFVTVRPQTSQNHAGLASFPRKSPELFSVMAVRWVSWDRKISQIRLNMFAY